MRWSAARNTSTATLNSPVTTHKIIAVVRTGFGPAT